MRYLKLSLFSVVSTFFITISPAFSQDCSCPGVALTNANINRIYSTVNTARWQIISDVNSTNSLSMFSLFGNDQIDPHRAGELAFIGTYIRFLSNKASGNFGTEAMRILANGNVGIGTFAPQSRLSVKGNMESQEIQVKASVADYVFSPDYNLLPLEDLEVYINENGHLPRIQNTSDVENNRGFVKLGELSISLMEKVEELTLHMIEMNKRLNTLEEENSQLRKKLNQIE